MLKIRDSCSDDRQALDRMSSWPVLKKIKDSGDFDYPLDLATSLTGEWWPYAYSPFLQSFGGDLINRTDYKSAEGVLNGDTAVDGPPGSAAW